MLKWFKKKLGWGAGDVAPEPEASPSAEPTPSTETLELSRVDQTPSAADPLPVDVLPEIDPVAPPIEKTVAELAALATGQGESKQPPPVEPAAEEASDLDAHSAVTVEVVTAASAEPTFTALPDETDVLETFEIEREELDLPVVSSAPSAQSPAEPPEAEETSAPLESAETAPPDQKKSWFGRLRERIAQTTDSLVNKVRSAILLRGKVDDELLEEIEEILLQSDVGIVTTTKIVERMRKEGRAKGTLDGEALLKLFKESIAAILKENNRPLALDRAHPMILLMVGVNGTGKTTTIGKIAKTLSGKGKLVMLVAADTFRAAAADQLQIWAERTGSCIVRQDEGADPAAVVYEALEGAVAGPTPDVILIDTAGRLHTKVNLMQELTKIVRVIKKFYPAAPHETILVLDATTGQNALNQVKIFHAAADLSGLIMTKLDGTAKGGILIACKDLHNLPVFKIGIGEAAEDLRDFDPDDFVDALFSEK